MLDQNRTIDLIGNFGDNRAISLSVTGVGPVFRAEGMLADGSSLTVSYSAALAEGGIHVAYDLTIRTLVKENGSIQYHDRSFSGRVLCKEGAAVQIYKNGTQSLSLGIDTEKK